MGQKTALGALFAGRISRETAESAGVNPGNFPGPLALPHARGLATSRLIIRGGSFPFPIEGKATERSSSTDRRAPDGQGRLNGITRAPPA